MQSVSSAFTAEEKDSVRKIAESLQVSWHKQSLLGNRTFTIGVSLIGGNDAIGANPGAIGSPANYKYFDESTYLLGLEWERGLGMPIGTLSKALASASLDNTSGRFTPRQMGGHSELYTAIQPRKPIIISAGFNFGIDQTIPQFAGILNSTPKVDVRNGVVDLQAVDYVDFFGSKYLDQALMFTAERTDTVLTTLFSQLGMSTAQYDLDTGINIIPFGYFESGTKFSDVIGQLVEAENGQLYQDESGIFKFENRQHWTNAPYTQVQKIILTGQVIGAELPDDSHIINVVEVNAEIRSKKPEQTIYRLNAADSISIPANSTQDVFIDFQDPILSMTVPTSSSTTSYFVANDLPDESGTDLTSSLTVSKSYLFAKSAKFTFSNTSGSTAYLTQLVITGRSVTVDRQLYVRVQDDSSVTAYNEQSYSINNNFIQDNSWANSLAQMILNDFSSPENLQVIIIRAIPELQLGDLISWQGRYWRIFDIKATLNPSVGFIQELTMLQRTITSYFRIGVSTIGGSDAISP